MKKRRVLFAAAAVLLVSTRLFAHHSFRAEYDESHLITLAGTVTKVMWKNPHVTLSLDVKDDNGNVAAWEMELASPNGLLRQGWKVDSLKPGDRTTVSGYGARDGSHIMNARRVVLGGKTYSAARDDSFPVK